MRCSMVSDVNADDRLLRSELLYIVRIMAGRLNMLSLVEHMMTPVLFPFFYFRLTVPV